MKKPKREVFEELLSALLDLPVMEVGDRIMIAVISVPAADSLDLWLMDPADVENVKELKDASAAALNIFVKLFRCRKYIKGLRVQMCENMHAYEVEFLG